jgi:hypothetical protein
MSQFVCPQEAAVAQAARTRRLPEPLAAHAAKCEHCRGIAQAAQWMQSLAQNSERTSGLPEANLVWWRAQLAEQRKKAARTQGALEWLAFASGATVPLGLAAWVVWNWYGIQAAAGGLLIAVVPQFSLAVVSLAALAPALLFLGAISLAYPLLARE